MWELPARWTISSASRFRSFENSCDELLGIGAPDRHDLMNVSHVALILAGR